MKIKEILKKVLSKNEVLPIYKLEGKIASEYDEEDEEDEDMEEEYIELEVPYIREIGYATHEKIFIK